MHLYLWRRKFTAFRKKQDQFHAHKQRILSKVNAQVEHHELFESCKRLRRDIRLMTSGAPTTEAHESPVQINFVAEQEWSTQTEVLKRAYRALAMKAHPDRGGDTDLFNAVNTAYRLRDSQGLWILYVAHVKSKDLQWIAAEGLNWLERQIRRLTAEEAKLRATPEYAIAQALMSNNQKRADDLADHYMRLLYVMLGKELAHVVSKNPSNQEGADHGEGRKEGEEQGHGHRQSGEEVQAEG